MNKSQSCNNNININEQFLHSAKLQLSLKALLKSERVKPGILNTKITEIQKELTTYVDLV